jgi:hypothetical protein
MLGFRGHWSTKSRRYSTTMTALRRARVQFAKRRRARDGVPLDASGRVEDDDQAAVVIATWSYVGRGYQTQGEVWLALSAAARARERRRITRDELTTTTMARLHSRSFARKDDAQRWLTSEEASKLRGAWVDPSGSRRRFDEWADEWWEVWSSEPRRSPATWQAAESHLRLHIRPYFGGRQLGAISTQVVQRWQNELERRASHNLTMACRSILNRILDAAEGERLIPINPVRKIRAPKRPVDPEVVFGRVRRRAFTPEEFGRFLAGCPAFYRDHFVVQVGTGLRSGELLGLRARRVDQAARRIEVVEVATTRAASGRATRTGPRATPASGRCRWPSRSLLRSRVVWPAADRVSWCSVGRVAATASHGGRGRGCRPVTFAGCIGWRRPGPSCPTWTCMAPTTCATRSRPGWRTAVCRPPGWPPWRARRQHDWHALPAHDRGDAGARGGGHRRSAGRGVGRHAPGVPQGGNSRGDDQVRARATGRVTCGGVGWS